MIGTNRGAPPKQPKKKEKGSKKRGKGTTSPTTSPTPFVVSSTSMPAFPSSPIHSSSSSSSWLAGDTPKRNEKKTKRTKTFKKKRKMSVDLGGKKKVQKERGGMRYEHPPTRVGSTQMTPIERVCKTKKTKQMCGSCGGKIPKKTKCVELLSGARYYHIPCFNCISCGSALREFAVIGGHPTCQKCLERKNYNCHECRLPIKGDFTDAMGKKWHPEHFCCSKCHKPLRAEFGEQTFFEEGGKPYCTEDYYKLFGKKCVCGCDEYIKGELVLCRESSYNPKHFVCKECEKDLTVLDVDKIINITQPSGIDNLFCSNNCLLSFTPSAFSTKIEKQMKKVKQEQTTIQKGGETCLWCEGPIAKNVPILISTDETTKKQNYFHLQHLECQDCGEHIPENFQWIGGEGCCFSCVAKRCGMVTEFFDVNSPPGKLSSFLAPMPKCFVCKEVIAEVYFLNFFYSFHPFYFEFFFKLKSKFHFPNSPPPQKNKITNKQTNKQTNREPPPSAPQPPPKPSIPSKVAA